MILLSPLISNLNALPKDSEMSLIWHGNANGSGGFNKDISELAKEGNRDGSGMPV